MYSVGLLSACESSVSGVSAVYLIIKDRYAFRFQRIMARRF